MILVLGIAIGTFGGLRWRADYTTVVASSRSMSSTVSPDDRILFRMSTQDAPHRGDVVLFTPSTWQGLTPGTELVQRVIGVGGDLVVCCDSHQRITVNGHAVTEDYVHPDPTIPASPTVHLPFRTSVPKGTVFLAGDDRGDSFDSRFRGPVADSDVLGVAVTDVSIGGYRRIPATDAFVAAGLSGAATRDGGYLVDPVLLFSGAVLVLVGVVWLLVVGLRAVLTSTRRRRR